MPTDFVAPIDTRSERDEQQELISECFVRTLGYKDLGELREPAPNRCVDAETLRRRLLEMGCDPEVARKAIEEIERDAFSPRPAGQEGGAQAAAADSLFERNRRIYAKLRYGIGVEGESGLTRVFPIDWAHPENNEFAVAQEESVLNERTGAVRRPDVVVYVNGLALATIELKKSGVDVDAGIEQLTRNQSDDEIGDFFTTQQLLCAGNAAQGLRYGAIWTPPNFYAKWRESRDASDRVSLAARRIAERETSLLRQDVVSLFYKERFLLLIRDFVIFDRDVKKIARHNQFFANMAARSFIERRMGGIVWNTQGSGKTLTMAWLARWVCESIPNGRALIVTDREELDRQIGALFQGVGLKIRRAGSGKELRELLDSPAYPIVTTLIHKYGDRSGRRGGRGADEFAMGDADGEAGGEAESGSEDDGRGEFARTLEREASDGFEAQGDIVCFIDECHRTNSGKLHQAMRRLMPNATLIGFTGTPLLKSDKRTTLDTFGPFIHRYMFDEAVKDKVILDLLYEARDVGQELARGPELDALFDAATAGMAQGQKEKLKKKLVSASSLDELEGRMRMVVLGIMADMRSKPRLRSGGAAMLVAGNIEKALRYWKLFQEAGFKSCAAITSYDPAPAKAPPEFDRSLKANSQRLKKSLCEEMLGGKTAAEFERDAIDRFKAGSRTMRLLIVVDKLLTGFDAPVASYLYIDKKLKDHNLIQAICRVNRIDDESKRHGFIVDYQDLFCSLHEAIADYTGQALQNFDPEDVQGLIVDGPRFFLGQMLECRRKLGAIFTKLARLGAPGQKLDWLELLFSEEGRRGEPGADGARGEAAAASEPAWGMRRARAAELARDRRAICKLAPLYAESFEGCQAILASDPDFPPAKRRAIAREVHGCLMLSKAIMDRERELADLGFGPNSPNPRAEEEAKALIDASVDSSSVQTLNDAENFDLLRLGALTLNEQAQEPVDEKRAAAQAEAIAGNIAQVLAARAPDNPKIKSLYERLKEAIDQRRKNALDYSEFIDVVAQIAAQTQEDKTSRALGLDQAEDAEDAEVLEYREDRNDLGEGAGRSDSQPLSETESESEPKSGAGAARGGETRSPAQGQSQTQAEDSSKGADPAADAARKRAAAGSGSRDDPSDWPEPDARAWEGARALLSVRAWDQGSCESAATAALRAFRARRVQGWQSNAPKQNRIKQSICDALIGLGARLEEAEQLTEGIFRICQDAHQKPKPRQGGEDGR